MAETPDEIFERTLAEEQAKGSSPQVAQARAKAARGYDHLAVRGERVLTGRAAQGGQGAMNGKRK